MTCAPSIRSLPRWLPLVAALLGCLWSCAASARPLLRPDLKRGQVVRVRRGVFYHYGVAMGDDTVVHRECPAVSSRRGRPAGVQRSCLAEFTDHGKIHRIQAVPIGRRTPEQTASWALSQIGDKRFNLWTANCEHFARQAANGRASSRQVQYIISSALTGPIGTAVVWLREAFERRAHKRQLRSVR